MPETLSDEEDLNSSEAYDQSETDDDDDDDADAGEDDAGDVGDEE
jgi:hypothetical protein